MHNVPDSSLRCEAAGTLMQPSLAHVLVPERVSQLTALGWRLDPSFGNYVQAFPAGMTRGQIADQILQTLGEVYDAEFAELYVITEWVVKEPCPPRNGFTQNLAGLINDAPEMKTTAVHACAYMPEPKPAVADPPRPAADHPNDSAEALIARYGDRVSAEIQRLRINVGRRVFVVFETRIGYVQCETQPSPPAIYFEAQSADSWQASSLLTVWRGCMRPDTPTRAASKTTGNSTRSTNLTTRRSLPKSWRFCTMSMAMPVHPDSRLRPNKVGDGLLCARLRSRCMVIQNQSAADALGSAGAGRAIWSATCHLVKIARTGRSMQRV